MKKDLLSFGSQAGVVGVAILLTINGDVWLRGGDLLAQCGIFQSSSSQHSMCATYEPRYIIFLVTPSPRV
jgi:hypothetical protein